ncbi:hypothetical protein N9137_02185 [Pseudomonadales bacterium]|nr:hypothetical protein [Pseudomonadales bacterium]
MKTNVEVLEVSPDMYAAKVKEQDGSVSWCRVEGEFQVTYRSDNSYDFKDLFHHDVDKTGQVITVKDTNYICTGMGTSWYCTDNSSGDSSLEGGYVKYAYYKEIL